MSEPEANEQSNLEKVTSDRGLEKVFLRKAKNGSSGKIKTQEIVVMRVEESSEVRFSQRCKSLRPLRLLLRFLRFCYSLSLRTE